MPEVRVVCSGLQSAWPRQRPWPVHAGRRMRRAAKETAKDAELDLSSLATLGGPGRGAHGVNSYRLARAAAAECTQTSETN
eukprot:6982111-Pyramimonas_sp.AAC.1